jgi:hypothetical protein
MMTQPDQICGDLIEKRMPCSEQPGFILRQPELAFHRPHPRGFGFVSEHHQGNIRFLHQIMRNSRAHGLIEMFRTIDQTDRTECGDYRRRTLCRRQYLALRLMISVYR